MIYDQNGNLVSGDGKFREYNSLNQLWKVYNGSSDSGTLLQEYQYHPTEERVHVKVKYNGDGNNETTIYISESFVRVLNSSGSFDYTYVYHNGQQVAQLLPSGEKEFIHGDHIGSSSVVTDESGNVIENTTYAPFGSVVSGGDTTKYDYENKEFDEDIGTYDFHFRTYNSEWGMFTKPDTVVQFAYDPQSLNRYSFERNNAYKYMDPDGHVLLLAVAGLALAVGAVVLGAGATTAWTEYDYQVSSIQSRNDVSRAEARQMYLSDEDAKFQVRNAAHEGMGIGIVSAALTMIFAAVDVTTSLSADKARSVRWNGMTESQRELADKFDDMDTGYTLTKHGVERASKQGISAEEIADALNKGTKSLDTRGGGRAENLVMGGNNIRLSYNQNNEIVTVFKSSKSAPSSAVKIGPNRYKVNWPSWLRKRLWGKD